jgi:sensor histidine kinase YesM
MQTPSFFDPSTNEKPLARIKRHLIFISTFILYEKIIVIILRPKAPIITPLLYYVPAIGLFYLNTFKVLMLWNKTISKFFIIILISILEIIAFTITALFIGSFISSLSITNPKISNTENIVSMLWRGVYFWGFSLMYWLHLKSIKSNRRADALALANAEAELEKVKLENKLLRSQINSHFLCNTLNSIYAMADGREERIARAVKLTSDFVLYTYTDFAQDNVQLVPLAEEIEQVNGLLEICSIRFGELPVHFDINIVKDSDFKIPPVFLLTFVENIFAHGLFNDPAHPVTISVNLSEVEFRFRARNMKNDLTTHKSTGIGVENAKARLATYYPDRFQFNTYNTDNYYSLDLKITL